MLRVAVVEDETEYRGLIQEMVGRYAKEYDLQIQTTAFPDGRELVQNYHKFDILLMDIEMPVLNGYQATMMIRGLNRTDRDVPVIAMTANVFADDKAEADKVGMNDYVTKPLKREKLLDVLKTWIDDRK